MTILEFKIDISAPSSIVWNALWEDKNYRKWTGAFCEGSYAKSDWKEGSVIHFLSPNGDGMFGKISKLDINHKMYFTHIGEIKNYEEQELTEAVKSWSGAAENYTLEETNGITTLTVNMDIVDDYVIYFQEKFPLGLQLVKQNAELLSK